MKITSSFIYLALASLAKLAESRCLTGLFFQRCVEFRRVLREPGDIGCCSQLTHQTGKPLHQASVEALGDQFVKPGNMVTNGAYMLTENRLNDRIKLKGRT